MNLCDTCDNRDRDPDEEPCNSCLSLGNIGISYTRTVQKPVREPSAWEKRWIRWANNERRKP